MKDVEVILSSLGPLHLEALRWFADREGQVVSWPGLLNENLYLVNRPKGIHKPKGWKYALSVRESLDGTYDDEEPELGENGRWRYRYFQENHDVQSRKLQYTNIAMDACIRDGVPVGVLRQVERKPCPKYKVLGVATVAAWDSGYFILNGLDPKLVLSAVSEPTFS
jgi:putative restriction endonuclease